MSDPTLNSASLEELQAALAAKLAIPAAIPAEVSTLRLTIKNSNGFVHELVVTKNEGDAPVVEWTGDSFKLTNHLNSITEMLQRSSTTLI